MQNEIGLAIRLARVAVGKSQWQVAAKIGIHPSILNLIESGKRVPAGQLARTVLDELSADAPRSPLVALVLKESQRIARAMSYWSNYAKIPYHAILGIASPPCLHGGC